jgi:hypothetical protein
MTVGNAKTDTPGIANDIFNDILADVDAALAADAPTVGSVARESLGVVCNAVAQAIEDNAGGSVSVIELPSSDSSATPGNATVNAPCGRSAIADGVTDVVITNSFVSAPDHVFVQFRSLSDAGWDMPGPIAVTTADGWFMVTIPSMGGLNAPAAFDWFVVKAG